MTQLNIPPIEQQLDDLHPACTAQVQRFNWACCGERAIAIAHIHAIDHCQDAGLTIDGDYVETLCELCLDAMRRATVRYAQRYAFLGGMTGFYPMCKTCGRPKIHASSLMQIRSIEGAL